MDIYLVRHGETTGDVEDRYGGWYDDHLTKRGFEQLKITAGEFAGVLVDVIYSSPLIRAKESAEIINEVLGTEIVYVDDIRERNYGVLGGLTKKEALEKFPDAASAYSSQSGTIPDSEDVSAFENRVIDAFIKIKEAGQNCVIVAHGGPIKVILSHLGKDEPELIGDGEIIKISL